MAYCAGMAHIPLYPRRLGAWRPNGPPHSATRRGRRGYMIQTWKCFRSLSQDAALCITADGLSEVIRRRRTNDSPACVVIGCPTVAVGQGGSHVPPLRITVDRLAVAVSQGSPHVLPPHIAVDRPAIMILGRGSRDPPLCIAADLPTRCGPQTGHRANRRQCQKCLKQLHLSRSLHNNYTLREEKS